MFNFLFREAVHSEVHVVYREIQSTLWRHTIDKETLPYTVWTLHSILTKVRKLIHNKTLIIPVTGNSDYLVDWTVTVQSHLITASSTVTELPMAVS